MIEYELTFGAIKIHSKYCKFSFYPYQLQKYKNNRLLLLSKKEMKLVITTFKRYNEKILNINPSLKKTVHFSKPIKLCSKRISGIIFSIESSNYLFKFVLKHVNSFKTVLAAFTFSPFDNLQSIETEYISHFEGIV